MALRSLWKGAIRFSLVTVPVEAFTAAEPQQGEVHLHQLHDACHSRIRYQKTCPIHGEVRNDEIVTGYEYEKDHYVIVDRKEVEQAQSDDHAIVIDTFISPDEIDPIYYDGRCYYLVPQNKGAEQSYAVMCQAMMKMNRCAMATVVLRGKEELLLVRPVDGVLTMTMLHYKSQIRSPEAVADRIPEVKTNAQELKLAQQLIEASTSKKFDFASYEDRYTDKLKELIEAKIAGKEIIQPPETEEEYPVINFKDALQKSVSKAKRGTKPAEARKMLVSHLSRKTGEHQRRRKSS